MMCLVWNMLNVRFLRYPSKWRWLVNTGIHGREVWPSCNCWDLRSWRGFSHKVTPQQGKEGCLKREPQGTPTPKGSGREAEPAA